jgi:hypothetical protein
VGIGTLAPAAKVDIFSTDTAQVRLSHSATNYLELRVESDQVLQIISPNQTQSAILIGKNLPGFVNGGVGFSTGDRTQFYGGSGMRFLVGAGREVGFYTENTERMRVNAGGNVGIGLINPISKFHVQGSDAAVVVNRVQGAAGQTANLAEWRNAGGKTLVGVSPEGQLNIIANNDLGRATAGIYVAADVLNPTTNALYITTGGNGGRLFLGSPEKSANLDLSNVTSINNAPAYVTGNFALGGTANSHGISRVGNDVAIWTSSSNGRLLHYTNPAGFGVREVLRYVVLPGGNFGIGVEEPTEKLHVGGKIKATSINFTGLPTSAAGLETGDVWNDNGTLKIV